MTTPQLLLADALGHPSSDKRIDILRRIGQVGSISEAARGAGVSYRAAWQALDTLSNLAGLPLLEKLVGGSGGGGARLTPAGLRLLEAADRLNQARTAVLAQIDANPGLAGGGSD
jgi:molybdate transport system regulatory protein